jgi:hypothetical protein
MPTLTKASNGECRSRSFVTGIAASSTVLLLLANLFARNQQFAGTKIVAVSLGAFCSFFFLMCMLPAVAIQSLLFFFATLAWRVSGRGPSFFGGLSCGATLVAYSFAGWLTYGYWNEVSQWRDQYRFESMTERLPRVPESSAESPLTAEADKGLLTMEEHSGRGMGGYRSYQLQTLHEDRLNLFVNSPGFGVGRMSYLKAYRLKGRYDGTTVPRQSGAELSAIWSPGFLAEPSGEVVAGLRELLEQSVWDFANAGDFGYIKDREHVAGFEGHRFTEVPEACERCVLKVQRLSLVGLVLSEEPRVYVSEELPRMDRVRETPTRALDRFEEFAMSRLRKGEDVVATEEGTSLRMLGSVRSFDACMKCHAGRRGDLLGAFSYVLGYGSSVSGNSIGLTSSIQKRTN